MTGDPADPHGVIAPENQRHDAAARKAIRVLLPVMIVFCMFSFLGRTNVSLARPAFQHELGIGPAACGLESGLFFPAQAFPEVPSNLVAHRVGPRRWTAVTWGAIPVAMILVHGGWPFHALRLLPGAAEAGLSCWFAHRERPIVVSRLYVAPPVALIFGNPPGAC